MSGDDNSYVTVRMMVTVAVDPSDDELLDRFDESSGSFSIAEVVRAELQSQGVSVANIPKKEFGKLVDAQRAELAKNYEIRIEDGEKIGKVFSTAAITKIKGLIGSYDRYLPLAAAIAFFFTFKALSLPLSLLSAFFALLLMKLLILARVVRKEREHIEVERLVL